MIAAAIVTSEARFECAFCSATSRLARYQGVCICRTCSDEIHMLFQRHDERDVRAADPATLFRSAGRSMADVEGYHRR